MRTRKSVSGTSHVWMAEGNGRGWAEVWVELFEGRGVSVTCERPHARCSVDLAPDEARALAAALLAAADEARP